MFMDKRTNIIKHTEIPEFGNTVYMIKSICNHDLLQKYVYF